MTPNDDTRPRVLVVDDAATVRAYHSMILGEHGFELHEAANGYEALERAVAEPFDLMLVDVNMPVMDGYSFVEAVRREALTPGVPIIMISTERESVDAEQAYRCGANLYLVKPVAPELLIANAKLLTQRLEVGSQ